MHRVKGLAFHPRGPSRYRLNIHLHVGQGACSDLLSGVGGCDADAWMVFCRLNSEMVATSGGGAALRAIFLLSTKAIKLLIDVVKMSLMPRT